MSSRNPRDLRQMVRESTMDMTDMKENLDKLRALSEDDKNENAKLKSRIDEQCQLIMILKQKADDGTTKIQTLERINKELLDFREQADAMLKTEIRKYNLLDGRFNNLVENHEEMIHIKDEYKRKNHVLTDENMKLKDENKKLFSKTVAEKDDRIHELDKICAELQDQCQTLEHKFRQQQVEWRGREEAMRKQVSELQTTNALQAKELHRRLQDTEERLRASEQKLKQQIEGKQKIETENSNKFQKLQKEKEELLTLVMQRGKIVQQEQENNKQLQKKIAEMEKSVQTMNDKFEREADAVNANLRVQKLSCQLTESDSKHSQMVKEFQAFKKHSNDLLQREKELNERLRHLYC